MSAAIMFFIIGIISTFAIGLFQWKFWLRWYGWVAAIIFAGFSALIVISLRPSVSLGKIEWYNEAPIKELILFILLVLGMVFQTLSYAVHERKRRTLELRAENPDALPPGLEIDRWELLLPLLVAVPVFCGLLSQIDSKALEPLTLAMAFQNGFMWRAVLQQSV